MLAVALQKLPQEPLREHWGTGGEPLPEERCHTLLLIFVNAELAGEKLSLLTFV